MKLKKEPGVNAGSMADIAFLMLIFFLVVTKIEADEGINTRLASEDNVPTIQLNDRNVMEISINDKKEILVEGAFINVTEITELTKKFIDNNGDGSCIYCDGARLASSSDNPNDAIVSLQHMRTTDYKFYVTVQNELIKAYNQLRNIAAKKQFGADYNALTKEQQKQIREQYPRKITEVPTN
ncbi:biopolymer transporter ExbD [Spongiivirga sp. MCCC 1A20706]|uniref:ExbD/TolR family protein n=1 Tax=Spongiivirga sp. MCCC 1A20706 TaxID=3160963 RepID=UPI003977CE31